MLYGRYAGGVFATELNEKHLISFYSPVSHMRSFLRSVEFGILSDTSTLPHKLQVDSDLDLWKFFFFHIFLREHLFIGMGAFFPVFHTELSV